MRFSGTGTSSSLPVVVDFAGTSPTLPALETGLMQEPNMLSEYRFTGVRVVDCFVSILAPRRCSPQDKLARAGRHLNVLAVSPGNGNGNAFSKFGCVWSNDLFSIEALAFTSVPLLATEVM